MLFVSDFSIFQNLEREKGHWSDTNDVFLKFRTQESKSILCPKLCPIFYRHDDLSTPNLSKSGLRNEAGHIFCVRFGIATMKVESILI